MWALFIPALMGALAAAMGALVGRAIIALGIGAITYTGLNVLINSLKANVIGAFSGGSADMLGLLGYLWIDKSLTIIMSAVTISLSMRLIAGSIKKMVLK